MRVFLRASEDQGQCEELIYLGESFLTLGCLFEVLFFSQVGEEKESFVARTREEAIKGDKESSKLFHFLHFSWAPYIDLRLKLVWISFNPSPRQHESKKIP